VSACAASLHPRIWASPPVRLSSAAFRSNARRPGPWSTNVATANSCCSSPVIQTTDSLWGQDRLVPLFLATLATRQQTRRITFPSAAEMLDTFGMQQGGSQYRRLVGAFQRIFGATIFFGTDTHRSVSRVVHEARFNFMSEARIWYSRDADQQNLPGECQNLIVLTEEFYREVLEHPIPTDLEAAKALSSSPAALDLFTWLSYRCFVARSEERIPLFGEFGLANQLGCVEYSRPRRFRERLEQWLRLVQAMWPECPARISQDGQYLLVNRATALNSRGGEHACA